MNPETFEQFTKWKPPYSPNIIQGGLLKPGSVMFIYGEYSTWKSWLSMDLAARLADGMPWLLWDTTPSKTLIINAELPKSEYWIRWDAYLKSHKVKHPVNLLYDNDQELNLDSFTGINSLIQWLRYYKIKVVIIDNLYTAMAGDLTKNTDANIFIKNMKRLTTEGIAIILVHHSRQERSDNYGIINQRAYEMFGSSFLTNWADTILETRGYKDADTITLTPQKHRLAELVPLTTMWKFNRRTLDFDFTTR